MPNKGKDKKKVGIKSSLRDVKGFINGWMLNVKFYDYMYLFGRRTP
jgi:hypothetical protein